MMDFGDVNCMHKICIQLVCVIFIVSQLFMCYTIHHVSSVNLLGVSDDFARFSKDMRYVMLLK